MLSFAETPLTPSTPSTPFVFAVGPNGAGEEVPFVSGTAEGMMGEAGLSWLWAMSE